MVFDIPYSEILDTRPSKKIATKKWAVWLIYNGIGSNVHFISDEVGNDALPILGTLLTTSIIL
jgi:hypothetical protein